MATTSALQLPPPSQAITIRPAQLDDLDRLVQIENRAFITDRFSHRTFRYLLTRANAVTIVAEAGGRIIGYAMVLFTAAPSGTPVFARGRSRLPQPGSGF